MTHHGIVPSSTDYDVAVVGLGPAGVTLANLLGAQNLRVLVLEREDESYHLPRAVHFDDECMRVFQSIGLAEEISKITFPAVGMRYVDAQGNIIIDFPIHQGLTSHGWRQAYTFHQPELEAVLVRGLARWPSVVIKRRSDVFALDQDERGVRIRFEDLASGQMRDVSAKFVVGCDGARSTVKRFIGTSPIDLGFHERWLVVDLLLKAPRLDLGDKGVQYCNPARSVTYVRGVGERRRFEIRLAREESPKAMMQPENVWSLLAPWISSSDATLERIAVYTFHSVIAEMWRNGRLFVAGDAAHQSPPFLGQGMCSGIRDVSNLAWKLKSVLSDGASERLLETYQAERMPHVRHYIDLAVHLGGVINTTAMDSSRLPGGVKREGNSVLLERKKPILGRGFDLGESSLIGRQIPQLLLSNGRRLDDAVGLNFCLLTQPKISECFSPDLKDVLQRNAVHVIDDDAAELQAWLADTKHVAVLVRPDRYVFGGVDSADEITSLSNAAFGGSIDHRSTRRQVSG